MRRTILAAAVLILAAPSFAVAADPVITYQTQPLGRMLNDLRLYMRNVGGEEALKSFNKEMTQALGEKGFAGFDLNRPIVGYIDVPAAPAEFVAVVAFPVTGEKEWLDFCERWNKSKPKELKDGIYEVPEPDRGFKAVMKVHDGYAYVATGLKDPARALDAKSIVPAAKLVDGSEFAYMSGTLHFERLPKELRSHAKAGLDMLKKNVSEKKFPNDIAEFAKVLTEQAHKLGTRFLDLSEGAKTATLRVNVNAISGEATAELSIVPLPGTPLEKTIAAYKNGSNRFGSLITPDLAGAARLKLPLNVPELQATAVAGLEAMQKEAANGGFPPVKAAIDEMMKCLIRTAKSGEADGVGVLRGPAKDGTFTGLIALGVDDPSGFEKEIKKFVDANAPPDFKEAFKWDAEKIGGVSVHIIDISKMPGGDREMKAIFGNNVKFAFAFAPKAAYAAIGPGDEPVAAIKSAMEAKPADGPMLEFALNPDRIMKLIGSIEPQGIQMAKMILGSDNQLMTKLGLDVTGGKEMKIKFTLNPRIFMGFFGVRSVEGKFEEIPAQELKK